VINQTSNLTWTSSASGDATAIITEYSGVDINSPIDVELAQGTLACSSPCNHDAPSVNTTQLNDRVITSYSAACGTASATWTAPSGSTERYEVATTGTLSSEISDVQQSGTGATGVKTATVNCSAGTVGVTQTVALRGRSTTCPAIRYRSGTANTTAGATSFVLNVPAGVQDGDVLIAAISAGAGTISAPSGWNGLVAGTNRQTWSHTASSEPASYTWTIASATTWAGVMDAYIGVDTSVLSDVTATTATGTAATVNWTSITSVTDRAWNIAVSFETNNVDTIAPPAGYTVRSAQGGA